MIFNYHSQRSKKARVNRAIDNLWYDALRVLLPILLLLGVALLIMNETAGWAVIGIAALPYTVMRWTRRELRVLPPRATIKQIDDVLEVELLGRMPRNPNVSSLLKAIAGCRSELFIRNRFALGEPAIEQLLNGMDFDLAPVWDESLRLKQQLNSQTVTASMVLIAIVKQIPGYDGILARVQLSVDNLVDGIGWYLSLRHLVEGGSKMRHTGGIGRDWSFGWTPLLDRFGQNWSEGVGASVFISMQANVHADIHSKMYEIFGTRGRQNVALVGSAGVGKTYIVQSFAASLMHPDDKVPKTLQYNQLIQLDAAALLSAAPQRGQLENLVNSVFNEAYASKNIILCLDNAQLFMEDGVGSVDLSSMLVPILDAGGLRIILTFNEQRYLQISRRNPDLVNALNKITVEPTNHDDTMHVLERETIRIESQHKALIMYQALDEAYRLGDRYLHDLEMPGKAINVLEAAALQPDEYGSISVKSVQKAVEQTYGVKVGSTIDAADKDRLLNLESLIHERMIDQVKAVNVVSDALRRARAGVRNQNRPIGAFLFLGPTGVGKTELAKAVSDVYFNGEGNLVRADMNEYTNDEDTARLIADGADNPNSLTAQVSKQPFSVVLLDEIEKANTHVIDTLLQALDEGVMRDINNKDVSFRDSIIIATSNAGADRIREYIDRGYDIDQFEDKIIDELINSKIFKPEFINRFDEIVVFKPLQKPELLQILDLIIKGVNDTLVNQKITVTVDDDAKAFLVDKGYDPRLGARPMRRVVQRAVESTVAKLMIAGQALPGSTIAINRKQVEEVLGE